MADGTGGRASAGLGQHPERPHTADLQAVATDWITIWQSELAAMATDREMQDTWVRLVTLWAQTAGAAARFLPAPPPRPPADDQAGRTWAAPKAGPATPMAAPDPRDTTIQHLASRVEELERQLREFAKDDGGVASRPAK